MGERILTTADLWLPGDVLGGALSTLATRQHCVCPRDVHEYGCCACGALQQPSRIDCTCPEVRDRIVRVLMVLGHDLLWVTAAELRGEITATVAAGILWASVLRVEAGLGPVRGVLGRWVDGTHGFTCEPVRYLQAPAPVIPTAALWAFRRHWRLLLLGSRSPSGETDLGHESADADAAALTAGYALLEPGGILLPLPDGVGRLENP